MKVGFLTLSLALVSSGSMITLRAQEVSVAPTAEITGCVRWVKRYQRIYQRFPVSTLPISLVVSNGATSEVGTQSSNAGSQKNSITDTPRQVLRIVRSNYRA
jgi:hypothetical protein